MAHIHGPALREAMRARAQWHEREANRRVGDPGADPEEVRHHRDLALQWRRLEFRLLGPSTDRNSIVSGA